MKPIGKGPYLRLALYYLSVFRPLVRCPKCSEIMIVVRDHLSAQYAFATAVFRASHPRALADECPVQIIS
jgi:hypothetical protein